MLSSTALELIDFSLHLSYALLMVARVADPFTIIDTLKLTLQKSLDQLLPPRYHTFSAPFPAGQVRVRSLTSPRANVADTSSERVSCKKDRCNCRPTITRRVRCFTALQILLYPAGGMLIEVAVVVPKMARLVERGEWGSNERQITGDDDGLRTLSSSRQLSSQLFYEGISNFFSCSVFFGDFQRSLEISRGSAARQI